MARKLAQEANHNQSGEDVKRPLLGRRDYLRVGAGALIAGVGAGIGASPAAGDGREYETVTLDPGEQLGYVIEDGERFGDILIDQTASGAMLSLRVAENANDWVIENVGWKGLAPSGGNRQETFLINVRGNGRIENVFIDQRDHTGGPGSDVGGIWTYSDSHHGHVRCRHNFIAGCGNNACYPSGDGWSHNPASGTVEHYRSYHRDNTVSNFRPGQEDCYVRECVSVVNDPDGTRGGYPSTGSQLSRAIWAWHHPNIYVENSVIWHDPDDVNPAEPFWATLRSGSAGNACELQLVDCEINPSWEEAGYDLFPRNAGGGSNGRHVEFHGLGYEPHVSVLGDGVPTTPEMAATGERNLPPELGTAPSGGVGEFEQPDAGAFESPGHGEETALTQYPYELQVDPLGSSGRTIYRVEFDGATAVGEQPLNAIVVDGVARGGVSPRERYDNVYFDGAIANVDIHDGGDARLIIVDPHREEPIGLYHNGEWRGLEETDAAATEPGTSDDPDTRNLAVAGGLGSAGVSGYMAKDRVDWSR